MALETGDHGDCPHCPPEMSQHHAGHDMARMETPCASGGDCDALTCDTGYWSGAPVDVTVQASEDLANYMKIPVPQSVVSLPSMLRLRAW